VEYPVRPSRNGTVGGVVEPLEMNESLVVAAVGKWESRWACETSEPVWRAPFPSLWLVTGARRQNFCAVSFPHKFMQRLLRVRHVPLA